MALTQGTSDQNRANSGRYLFLALLIAVRLLVDISAVNYQNLAETSGPEGKRLFCLPGPEPSRNEAVAMFLKWAKARLQYMGQSPVETGMYWDGQVHRPFTSEGGHADFAPRRTREIIRDETCLIWPEAVALCEQSARKCS